MDRQRKAPAMAVAVFLVLRLLALPMAWWRNM